MTGLALLLFSSAFGFALAQRFRLPVIPLLILLGFALARFGADLEREALNQVLDIGLAFLVFTAGIELNPARFRGRTRAVLWIGGTQFVLAAALGFLLARLFDFALAPALYIAAALSTSSTLVVVREIHRFPGSFESYGRLVLGVLLVQDIAVIVLVVLLRRLPVGPPELLPGILGLAVMAGAAIICQRYLPKLATKVPLPDEETLLLCTLGLLFLFSGFSHLMELTFIAGGFAAGIALSGFPVSGEARGVLGSLATFFLAVFFGALGAQVDLPDSGTLFKALGLSAIVLIATPIIVTVFAEWKGGLSSRSAITAGLLLAQTSEFSVILAVYGERLGQIDHNVVTLIALVAVMTMTLTPFLATDPVARFLLRLHPVRRRLRTDSNYEDHVVVLGYGSAGRWIVRPLISAGLRIVVVDQDPGVNAQLRKAGIDHIRGDASDEKILLRAGADKARFIIVSLPHADEVVKVIEHVGTDIPVFSRIFEESAARQIAERGGIPILNSVAAADKFMEWFESLAPDKPEIRSPR
jgi:Kef-type K+ transport system membrane component KefB